MRALKIGKSKVSKNTALITNLISTFCTEASTASSILGKESFFINAMIQMKLESKENLKTKKPLSAPLNQSRDSFLNRQ